MRQRTELLLRLGEQARVHRIAQRVPPTRIATFTFAVHKPDGDKARDGAARRLERRLERLGAAAERSVGLVVGVQAEVGHDLEQRDHSAAEE